MFGSRRLISQGIVALVVLSTVGPVAAQPEYDLLLKGGHVIDPRNGVDAIRDVAVQDGAIARVAEAIDPDAAFKTIELDGLLVTPGLIDIHVHAFAGPSKPLTFARRIGVRPDAFALRTGVTTVVDAGSTGWQDFETFKDLVIDRSTTRVLAFLNIAGRGMRGGDSEQVPEEMDPAKVVEMVERYPELIVGIKTAHYRGRDFVSVDRAVEAGELTGRPVMVDFGRAYEPEKTIEELLTERLRAGDIYTHVYSGLRGELGPDGRANPALLEGRERGVLFDVGYGGLSFTWRVAVPIIREGLPPDTISTDLHTGSMNAGMKDMLNVMSQMLAIGLPLEDVILRSTWNPAQAIGRTDLGHLSEGAPADLAVLRVEDGDFGFLDVYNARMNGDRRLSCEMTVIGGKVVYERNGLSRPDWKTLPPNYRKTGDPRWDRFAGRRRDFGGSLLQTEDDEDHDP